MISWSEHRGRQFLVRVRPVNMTLWIRSLLCTLLLRFSSCICQAQVSGDFPVLTQLTEPREHGEGPHWDSSDQVLYYVDISRGVLHRYDPSNSSEKTISFDKPVTLAIPVKDQKNKFVIGLGLDLVVLTWDWNTGFSSTSPIVSVDEDHPRNRFNDGKADANGRIWAGTMGYEDSTGVELNVSSLYRVDNNPTVPCKAEPMVRPVSISNGLAWREDNKVMYYVDSPTRRVDAFDFNLTDGTISNQRTVFEFGDVQGNPDGMTIDIDGYLWIACWNGSQVIQVNPTTGQLLRQIKLPVERVSSVTFGGPKLDTLFVTTMRAGLGPEELEQQPQAGAVFQISNIKAIGTPSKPAIVNCKCAN